MKPPSLCEDVLDLVWVAKRFKTGARLGRWHRGLSRPDGCGSARTNTKPPPGQLETSIGNRNMLCGGESPRGYWLENTRFGIAHCDKEGESRTGRREPTSRTRWGMAAPLKAMSEPRSNSQIKGPYLANQRPVIVDTVDDACMRDQCSAGRDETLVLDCWASQLWSRSDSRGFCGRGRRPRKRESTPMHCCRTIHDDQSNTKFGAG